MNHSDEIGEAELVVAARKKGRAGARAFETLVRQHQAWLVRFLQYLLGSRADAEDVAQEVFLRAFVSLDGYRGEGALQAWLRIIATRLAYNHRRDANTQRSKVDRLDIDSYVLNGSGPVMARDAIEKVLELMSYPFREVLILRHVEELSLDGIATMLGLGESAAKMRLSRARAQFWQLYEDMVQHESA